MHDHIIVVDDDEDIREIVCFHLKESGFEVSEYDTAADAMNFMKHHTTALLILDLKLPDADGIEICKEIKRTPELRNIPIIMLTGRGDETDRILGLELGADDYVTKPFSARELVARVKTVLRRKEPEEDRDIIECCGRLKIDRLKYQVMIDGKETSLTTTEFKILEMLAMRKGWVFTRQQILDAIWGPDKVVVDRSVDVHIKNLKKKMGTARKLIHNIRGVGYKIDD
jgi:DNA-binding response OmpR family regulator